jgi:hypothetical protein
VLLDGSEPISFLGGLFVGSVPIQLFFHASTFRYLPS